MSTQRKPEYIEDTISEESVRNFLRANPDFFERNTALLDSLELPGLDFIKIYSFFKLHAFSFLIHHILLSFSLHIHSS